MGYEFSEGLKTHMINSTVMKLELTSRNPFSFNEPVKFEWNVTEIYNKSFKLQMFFTNVSNLTPRDLLKVRFLKPTIFYINRTLSE